MNRLTLLVAVAVLAVGAGCRRDSGTTETASETGELLVRVHFVGVDQVGRDTNSAKLKQIASLPESRAFAEQTLRKLAHAPRTLHPQSVDAGQDERGAALLRPLLDDLVRNEFFLEVRGAAASDREWTLMVQLPPERLKAWGEALPELLRVWRLGEPVAGDVEGLAGGSLKRGEPPVQFEWLTSGTWVALGMGPSGLPVLREAARRMKAGGRPVNPATDYWVDMDLNLTRLAGEIGLPGETTWPRVRLKAVARGDDLRTSGSLEFPGPMTGPLGVHQVPAESIREPIISFASARGIGPLLGQIGLLRDLGITPPPNELTVWGQSGVFFQTFWTFPAADAPALVQRVADRLPKVLGEEGARRGINDVVWQSTNNALVWKRLPLIVPRLRAGEANGRPTVFGEIFPPLPNTNAPPADLFRQLEGRTNLVYYGWELTEQRLSSWHWTSQLLSIIARRPQLTTNYPGLRWMVEVGPRLGNTVTEVTAASPSRWEVTRRSHLGLGALEIVLLTRWLESTNFPALSLDPVSPQIFTNRPAASAPAPAKR